MSQTPRFALPLLTAGQAQKELFHNEAVVQIDALLHATAEAIGVETPAVAPEAGQLWIVGAAPTDAWTGMSDHLAVWTDGGWRFITPREGMPVMDRGSGRMTIWRAGTWQVGVVAANEIRVGGDRVIGPRHAAIGDPAGGETIDDEARGAITAVLAALRAHGLIAG